MRAYFNEGHGLEPLACEGCAESAPNEDTRRIVRITLREDTMRNVSESVAWPSR